MDYITSPTLRQSMSPPAALPLTFHLHNLPTLIIGATRLAASRGESFHAAGAQVTLISEVALTQAPEEVQMLDKEGIASYEQVDLRSITSWETMLEARRPALICVTDTLIDSSRQSSPFAEKIYRACTALRIPVNIFDHAGYSTYSFPSVHRFLGDSGQPSNLQVAVSTNGQGCRLAGRIKRDIVSRLPTNLGAAVDNVGKLRAQVKAGGSDQRRQSRIAEEPDVRDVSCAPLNSPVPQSGALSWSRSTSVDRIEVILDEEEEQVHRMRWVHQMSEYHSFEYLARLKDEEIHSALKMWSVVGSERSASEDLAHQNAEGAIVKGKGEREGIEKGRILLIGSGPGHPGLLTLAAHHALKTATLVLSDKLVPSEILALIPSKTKLHIAKKFPGNAEGAQNEMMEMALEGARQGEVVARLKQGDPFVYGRGGEEVLYFRDNGFESTVIPGISSALAAPLMMGIPVTQRGVAESLVMCTAVGRAGKAVKLPGYVKSRTLVMLMGVARINQVVEVLTGSISTLALTGRDGNVYPGYLPIGIIERASSPDQRVILSTLSGVVEALSKVEERPPGMMIVGWSVLCIEGKGNLDILHSKDENPNGKGGAEVDGEKEREIVNAWLGEEKYKVREGLSEEWRELLGTMEA